MDIEVLQENLSKALLTVSRFVSTHSQLPVLSNILLVAQKTKLTISATNLETSASISLGAKVIKEGELTIPAKSLLEVVSNLPSGNVQLSSENESLKITGSNFKGTVSGMNSSDFPKVPQTIKKEGTLSLPKEKFLEALSQVSFAASTDEGRPVLTGILFLFSKKSLSLVATDGFRLSKKNISLDDVSEDSKIILPKTVLLEVLRGGEEVKDVLLNIKGSEKQAIFGTGDLVLSSRILEGEYPDFEKIIPKSSSLKIRVDKEEFLRIVKLGSVFARDSANILKIKVLKDSLKIMSESSQVGSQEGVIDAKVEGEGIDISFNYKFLEDFLKVVKGEEILMEFNNSSSPGVFKDPKDPELLHLIMPVKIQN